jgi:hypothetical protein
MVAELNGASSARQNIAQTSSSESDGKTRRIPTPNVLAGPTLHATRARERRFA